MPRTAIYGQRSNWYKRMKVYNYGENRPGKPCVLLLGYFDGVHVGHRALIARAKALSAEYGCETGITTFYDAKAGGQIYLFEERLSLFEKSGIDFVCAAHFDEAFRKISGGDFLETLAGSVGVCAFVCGEDYTFGNGAACGVKELEAFCARKGIRLLAGKLVKENGEKAAATRAKKLLDEGDVVSLAKLLGEPYFIKGKVSTEGRHIGRRIGFPTANLHLAPGKYPLKCGVYAVTVHIGGKSYRGIANYGARPTFGDERVVLEVYADGYAGDLYGKEITVCFDFYLREIRKFSSGEELSRQLKCDLEKIR